MSKIICSPGEYIQGKGEMKRLADYYESADRKGLFLVKGAYMIVDSFFSTEQYKKQITESFQKKNIPFSFNVFGGECCMKEIEKHKNNMNKYDMMIGIGGGKTLDTAKAVSFYAHMPVMIVPTVASSDAPCSRLAVIYKEDGTFEKYLPRAPIRTWSSWIRRSSQRRRYVFWWPESEMLWQPVMRLRPASSPVS